MKALKIVFLLPLSMLSLKMTAQIDDLLKNKDITWIAEVYNDFIVDESFEAAINARPNIVVPLKFINTANEGIEERFAMQNWLFTAIENKKIPIFEDYNCTKQNASLIHLSSDSITQIDPITLETKAKVVKNKPHLDFNPLFRAKQIVYYNAKQAKFGVRTLALAPLYRYKDFIQDEMVWKTMPLFWFKPTNLNKIRRLNDKQTNWARQININQGISISADSVKILKKVSENMPLSDLFATVMTNPKRSFYKSQQGILPTQVIPFEERKKMFNSRDTLRIIDPNTYELTYKVIDEVVNPRDCEQLQIIQNVYWNDKKKRLEICTVATAPLAQSPFGSYKLPLFYCLNQSR
ncbi:MAG: hypothetical protein JNL70_00585 [Saprospiraceae bacterium]|nr:hypothetical protein [Saprospiraceae bacterium]